jgi:hypothetical protein
MSENKSNENHAIVDSDKTRYRVILESVYRFRQFYVAFVFAILSFAMQFPTKTVSLYVKVPEIGAWVLLTCAGYFALKDCGGFEGVITEKVAEGIDSSHRKMMWKLFFWAIVLLLITRIIDSLFPIFKSLYI